MWKKEYHELYFNEKDDINLSIKASLLKYDNSPKSLFKYMKSKYAKKSLEDDFIKASNSFEVNDPFEGNFLYECAKLSNDFEKKLFINEIKKPAYPFSENEKTEIIKSPNPIKKVVDILYNENKLYSNERKSWDEINNEFSDVIQDFKKNIIRKINNEFKKQNIFVCLSENNNITPMWAHYADNHTGVCIEYDIFNSRLFENCHPILYIKHADFTEDINKIDDNKRNKLKLLEEPFLKKSYDWSYENEWRVLLNKKRLSMVSKRYDLSNFIIKRNDLCFIKFPKPSAVYIGLKISQSDEKEIKKICQNRGIKVYKMKKDESKYNLTYEEV